MDGIGGVPGAAVRFIGPKAGGLVIIEGGFRPNGSSTPTIYRGAMASGPSGAAVTTAAFSVAYSATGLYTVTFTNTGFKFPTGQLPRIYLQGEMADVTNTNRFQLHNKGGWSNTTRSFVIAAWQDTAAFAIPSDANNWINFMLVGSTK